MSENYQNSKRENGSKPLRGKLVLVDTTYAESTEINLDVNTTTRFSLVIDQSITSIPDQGVFLTLTLKTLGTREELQRTTWQIAPASQQDALTWQAMLQKSSTPNSTNH